jgi:hypothetical protein
MSNNKTCTKCGEEKPATLEYFHKSGSGDGICAVCKVCVGEYNKAHYKANREARNIQSRAYNEANKEAIREQQRRYCESEVNRAAARERSKSWYEANREAALVRHKEYYHTPRGKFASIKGKASQRGISFSLLFELYETQLWGKPCHYCGCEIEVTGLDRKDSSKGYSRDNVVPCCWGCNSKKKDKTYDQFVLEQNLSEGHNK